MEGGGAMIRKAMPADLPAIMEIINEAKVTLKASGIDQWQKGYPNESVILQDMAGGYSYIYLRDGIPAATFAFFYGEDPTYEVITEGQWLTDNPYTVSHRITIKGTFRGQGVLGEIVAWAGDESRKRGYSSMRIDTHPENKSMQRALQKAGYTYCGHILTSIGDMRWGYEKLL